MEVFSQANSTGPVQNLGPALFPISMQVPRHALEVRRRMPHSLMRGQIKIGNCWVLNTARAKQIEACVLLRNTSLRAISGQLRLKVIDPRSWRVLKTSVVHLTLSKESTRSMACLIEVLEAEMWDFDNQNMYQLQVTWQGPAHNVSPKASSLNFAFLEFPVEGVGQDAMFRMRNRKQRLRAVIPWSCWTMNELLPVGEIGVQPAR